MLLAVVMAIANCVMSFLVRSVESDLSSPVAIKTFAMSVTDNSSGTFQIPVVALARMVSASVVVVVEQVSKQQLMPRDRFPTEDPKKVVQCSARQGPEQYAKEAQQYCHVLLSCV